MPIRFKRALHSTVAVVIVGIASMTFLSVSSLKDPESELASIRADLTTAQDRIDAALNISGRPGLGPQTVEADENYASAMVYYATGEFPATIRMLNNYLNNTQVPDFTRYQKAQYLLGRSYESLGRKTNAIRAYLRYIAAFLTAKVNDHDEFLDVLRRTVAISIDANEQSAEAGALIASLTSLELPGEVKNIVNVIAAKSAVINRNNNVAGRLLEETLKNSGDKTLKAKALYIKSLLAISQKNYEAAEEYLSEAASSEVDQSTRDLARLGLARLSLKRNKPTTALKHYELLDEKSDHFKEALFESIFIHIETGQDNEARARALLFLTRFKDSVESVQLRMILAYLDLKAGDYSAAKATLETADQRVQEVDQYLYKNLINKTHISSNDLSTLSGLTAGHIDDAPAVREASKVFAKLSALQKTLGDIDGEIRSVTLALSQAGLEQLNPSWVNRSEQLAEIGDQLLGVGHRLIATERFLYEKDIEEISRQKLESSENRRSKLLGANISLKRKNINWKSYKEYLLSQMTLKDSTTKLASAEADLSAIKLAKQQNKSTFTDAEIEVLATKISRLRAAHRETVRQSNLTKLKHSGKEGPHHGARLFLSQYVISLEEEANTIEAIRESQSTTAIRLLAGDAKESWKLWRHAVGTVLQGFKALDDEINKSLEDSVRKLDALTERQRGLSNRLSAIVGSVEAGLGANLHSILNQYSLALNKKSARNKKWRADIDWLEYQKQQDHEAKITQKYNLEQQILNENLRDIKQGLIW